MYKERNSIVTFFSFFASISDKTGTFVLLLMISSKLLDLSNASLSNLSHLESSWISSHSFNKISVHARTWTAFPFNWGYCLLSGWKFLSVSSRKNDAIDPVLCLRICIDANIFQRRSNANWQFYTIIFCCASCFSNAVVISSRFPSNLWSKQIDRTLPKKYVSVPSHLVCIMSGDTCAPGTRSHKLIFHCLCSSLSRNSLLVYKFGLIACTCKICSLVNPHLQQGKLALWPGRPSHWGCHARSAWINQMAA